MTFQKVTGLLLLALILGLAWLLWDPAPEILPAPAPEIEQGQETVQEATAPRHDGLLQAPRFSGQVLDERRLAYPGVEVQVCGTIEPFEVLAEGTTDAAGRYEIDLERAACSHRYYVRARSRPDFPWASRVGVDPGEAAQVEVEDLLVARPAIVHGRVQGPANRRLAGLDLVFVQNLRAHILQVGPAGTTTRTNAEGGFEVALVPWVPHQVTLLGSDRFETASSAASTFRPGHQELVIQARPLAHSQLEFRFWTATRRPHPGVKQRRLDDPDHGWFVLEARSAQVPPSIVFRKRYRADAPGRIDVVMPAGARVALQPRPMPFGSPKVKIRYEFLGAQPMARIGRSPAHPLASPHKGSFEVGLVQGQVLLGELQPGLWRFWLQALGWDESHVVEIELREGGLRPLRILPIVGRAELSGDLRDATGKLLTARLLRLYQIPPGRPRPDVIPRRAPHQGPLAQIRTDSHGRFRLVGLPLAPYELWTRARSGQETPLAEDRLQSGKNPPLSLVLQK